MALAITANLLTIELIHRMLVVLFEVCFTLQGGTPGKRAMGLSIISCTKCIPVGKGTFSLFHLLNCSEYVFDCLQEKIEYSFNLQRKSHFGEL